MNLKDKTMKNATEEQIRNYVILNWKSGELMDYNFNPVRIEEAEIYEDREYAENEIDSRGEPFCKVIEIKDLESELKKTEAYNKLGGVSLYSLNYGQKFRVLQKGWEDKTFVFQPQKYPPKDESIFLYEKENHGGLKIRISNNIVAALKVEVIK